MHSGENKGASQSVGWRQVFTEFLLLSELAAVPGMLCVMPAAHCLCADRPASRWNALSRAGNASGQSVGGLIDFTKKKKSEFRIRIRIIAASEAERSTPVNKFRIKYLNYR